MQEFKSPFNIADLNPSWWTDCSRTDRISISQPNDEVISLSDVNGSGTWTQGTVGFRAEADVSHANRNIVRFAFGANERYNSSFGTDPALSFELTVVCEIGTATSTMSIFSQQDGTGTGRSIISVKNTNGVITSFLGGVDTNGTSDTRNSGFHVYAMRHNTTTNQLRMYVDGALEETATRNVESATGSWRLGSNKNATGNYLDGDIAEFLHLNGETPDVIFNAYQRHLCDKWGIKYNG